MDDNKFLSALLHLERIFPVNSLKIDGAHVWPLVRFHINTRRKYNFSEHSRTSAFGCMFNAVWAYLRHFISRKHARSQLRKLNDQINQSISALGKFNKTSFLILCLEKEHYQTIHGKAFAPLLDSIQFLSENSCHDYLKISLGWKGPREPYYATKNLNLSPFVAKENLDSLFNPRSFKRLLQSLATSIWLALITFILKLYDSNYSIDAKEILDLITKLRGQRILFKKLLETTQPKAVFMTSYTGRIGLVCAARELNIPVVDVQHGGMYKDHPYSANWSNIPKGGYWYVPDYYWCWNETAAKIIINCQGNLNDLPKTLLGGHPWLGLCMSDNNHEILDEVQLDFMNKLASENKKIVLLALQYGPGSKPDQFVIDLIKETHKEWRWLIRLHPMGRDLKSDLTQDIVGYIEENDIDVSTEIPLHILLKEVDNVVTGFSTISAEALNFGIRTTIFSPIGFEFFKTEITAGEYDYVDNKNALKVSLMKDKTMNTRSPNAAIPTKKTHISQIMDNFLHSA